MRLIHTLTIVLSAIALALVGAITQEEAASWGLLELAGAQLTTCILGAAIFICAKALLEDYASEQRDRDHHARTQRG